MSDGYESLRRNLWTSALFGDGYLWIGPFMDRLASGPAAVSRKTGLPIPRERDPVKEYRAAVVLGLASMDSNVTLAGLLDIALWNKARGGT